jgi:hypothetical protein
LKHEKSSHLSFEPGQNDGGTSMWGSDEADFEISMVDFSQKWNFGLKTLIGFRSGRHFFECRNPSIPVGLTSGGQNLGSGVVQKREKVIFLGLRSKIHVVNHGNNLAF